MRHSSQSAASDRRLAILCLTPDAGHLIPLLKIAAHSGVHSQEVQVIAPEELLAVAKFYGFTCFPFGRVKTGCEYACLQAYLRAPSIARVIMHNSQVRRYYLQPLIHNVKGCLIEVKRLLKLVSPTLLLADESLFGTDCARLARELGIPILLHKITANLHTTNRNTFRFGHVYASPSEVGKLTRDLGSKLSGEIKFAWRQIVKPARQRRNSVAASDVAPLEQGIFKLASSTSLLEETYLANRIDIDEERIVIPLLPPLHSPDDNASGVYEWLNNSPDDVVYISFGTVVVPNTTLMNNLVREFVGRGKRVLIQASSNFGISNDGWVRCERWLSQPSVLSHQAVKLFVSHGGSGAVQETIWAGQPILCFPHGFDHHYCSWVVQQLGIGIVVERYQSRLSYLTQKKISQMFLELEAMRERVQKLSAEVRSQLDAWDRRDLWKVTARDPAAL